jgi:hypothetical protein
MPEFSDIKKQIVDEVTKRHSSHPQFSTIMRHVHEELSLMETTVGLESHNNLESFYSMWKANAEKVADDNLINSWTAYAIGMTRHKPVEGEFLALRRAFARAGFPDVDTDFDYEHRDDVYQYMIGKYGRENVGNIGTHGLLKFKSCVTRLAKALDLADAFDDGKDEFVSKNAEKVTQILAPFPKSGLLKVYDGEGKGHLLKTFDDAYNYSEEFRSWMDMYPDMAHHARHIEGTFATFGCLSSNTPILTDKGWARIDELSSKHKVAYVNEDGGISYTVKFRTLRTGRKRTFRMRLSNGSFIDVTDEHLVFTDRGCVEFAKIRKDPKTYKVYGLKKRNF